MSSHQRHEELLRLVEHHQEQYLKALRALHETLAASTAVPSGGFKMERGGSSSETLPGSPALRASHPPPSPIPPSPKPKPIHTLSMSSDISVQSSGPRRGRRLTNDMPDLRRGLGIVPRGTMPVSIYDAESDTEDDVDFIHLPPSLQVPRSTLEEPRVASVQSFLPPQSFSAEELVQHIRNMDESKAGTLVKLLDEVWKRRNELDVYKLFDTREDDLYGSATYEAYDVGRDSCAVPCHDERGSANDGTLDMVTFWNNVKDVNLPPKTTLEDDQEQTRADHEESDQREGAVGRMIILQEPSPIMLSSMHLTMSNHFDMDELVQHLITLQGNKGKTRAYMQRAFEQSEVRQRSFFFVFKYYTAVGEDLNPAPYQQFDRRPQDRKSPDHIDITECSSVLALSLGGPPVKKVQLRSRRRRVVQTGWVYDHFAPWHLLSIQSFPDDEHSIRSDDTRKPFYSGPYAFLDSLAAEYRDAVKRYTRLNEMITKLITPSNQFIFEVKLRDKLLFEDKHFTYSRRYFWAYNSLALINDGIKSMTAAYVDTFTPDFWEGRHQTLWPLQDLSSVEARNYLDKLSLVREELRRTVEDLGTVYHKNEQLRKEIKSLREQLFSGSSVKESRRAIEQGDNIKLLTSVSMIFLPLTFVTSVFGITEFHIAADDWRFPATMLSVCVPFFVLILILQTRAGMGMVKKVGAYLEGFFRRVDERAQYRRELQSLAAAEGLNNGASSSSSSSTGPAAAAGGGGAAGGGTAGGAEAGGVRRQHRFGRREGRRRARREMGRVNGKGAGEAAGEAADGGAGGGAGGGTPGWWDWGRGLILRGRNRDRAGGVVDGNLNV